MRCMFPHYNIETGHALMHGFVMHNMVGGKCGCTLPLTAELSLLFLGFTAAFCSQSDGGVNLECIDAYAVLE